MYPVLLSGTIMGALPGPSLLLLSISLFHSSRYFSTFRKRPFTAVKPRSSHTQPVARLITTSKIFRGPQGLKARINSLFILSMSFRKSCSDTPAGSRISG